MENRIKKVMSDIDVSSINDNTSPENVESLKQMNIIVALEEEFSDEDIIEMLICSIVKQYL